MPGPLLEKEAAYARARNCAPASELRAAAAVEAFPTLTEVRPAPAETRGLALMAFEQFGKGRHPAALNFGDCFAYACARFAGTPLLYKGDDFAQTDIDTA